MIKLTEKKCGIYGIKCVVNGKVYIGRSEDIRTRWRSHKNDLKSDRHINKQLQKDWNEFGEDSFEFKVIDTPEGSLYKLEKKYIAMYRRIDKSYNVLDGGSRVEERILNDLRNGKYDHIIANEKQNRMIYAMQKNV